MKEGAELVLGWLRKAQSDSVALEATLRATAFDAACFHAQQAAEKYLKAFLTHHDAPFPYTHNLAKLLELSAQIDPSFRPLLPRVEPLTPYAVRPRYDAPLAEPGRRRRKRVQQRLLCASLFSPGCRNRSARESFNAHARQSSAAAAAGGPFDRDRSGPLPGVEPSAKTSLTASAAPQSPQ